MTAQLSKAKAISWFIATIVTPLSLSSLCANGYIAYWYFQMEIKGTPHQGSPPLDVIQRGVFYTAGIGLWLTVFIWWLIHRKKCSFSALYCLRTTSLPKDIAWGLLLGVAWILVYGLLGWPAFSSMFLLNKAKLVSIPTSLSAGFCEEFLFRGFLITLVAQAGGGKKMQILWSSIAFGLAHLLWGPIGALFTVLLGLSFATITIMRGNVWAAVTAHSILNLCIEPGLINKAMSMYSQ
jgi:membrane protease YdiL (CAAX protease family)